MRAFVALSVAVLLSIAVGVTVEPKPLQRPLGTIPSSFPLNGYSPAPFALTQWAKLAYPGLGCGHYDGLDDVVIEKIDAIHFRNQPATFALVELSCNLNHRYANLFLFKESSNALRPDLVQRLTPAGNWPWQDNGLRISTNRIALDGITADGTPLCCPNLSVTYRWEWNGVRYQELNNLKPQPRAMPNIIGLDLSTAEKKTTASGIFSFFIYEARDPGVPSGDVSRQSIKAGTRLHYPLPKIYVWISTGKVKPAAWEEAP